METIVTYNVKVTHKIKIKYIAEHINNKEISNIKKIQKNICHVRSWSNQYAKKYQTDKRTSDIYYCMGLVRPYLLICMHTFVFTSNLVSCLNINVP